MLTVSGDVSTTALAQSKSDNTCTDSRAVTTAKDRSLYEVAPRHTEALIFSNHTVDTEEGSAAGLEKCPSRDFVSTASFRGTITWNETAGEASLYSISTESLPFQ